MAKEPLIWQTAVEVVQPYLFKVCTRSGHGSGFLFAHSHKNSLCAIATANHVISTALEWEETIRLEHYASGETFVLHENERAILAHPNRDTAAIIMSTPAGPLPKVPIDLIGKDDAVKLGNEIGWLGFPSVAPDRRCFFSGRISSRLEEERSYLVDGVAINGVSGGPAFYCPYDGKVHLIGLVTAYLVNTAMGGTLPGLAVIRHVDALHDAASQLKSIEDAKRAQEEQVTNEPEVAIPPSGTKAPSN